MKRVHLVAAKPMRYGTRRLKAGETFDASRAEAQIYRAIGWASDVPATAPAPVRAARVVHAAVLRAADDGELRTAVMQVDDDLDVLRTEYEMRADRAADKRWGVTRLKSEIEDLP
jgi:hypothetical protein